MNRTLLTTSRFNVELVQHTLPNGTLHQREIIRHQGAVVILPLVDCDHVCMLRNFRISVNQWLWELPAGTLEKGEHPDVTASRELKEETGYEATKIQHVHTFCMSPGIMNEQMYFYVADGLTAGNHAREVGELMENHIFSWPEVDHMIRSGKIVDGKSLVSLLWYMRYRTHA